MTILDTINDALSRLEQQHDEAPGGPWESVELDHADRWAEVKDDGGSVGIIGMRPAVELVVTLHGAVDFLLGTLYDARAVAADVDQLGGDEAVQHRLARSKTLDAGYRLANIILGRDS